MIELSRMNGDAFVLNADLIKTIESTPDTVLTLVSGERLMVREAISQICDRIESYRRRLFQPSALPNSERGQRWTS